jgi:hypothetical protein
MLISHSEKVKNKGNSYTVEPLSLAVASRLYPFILGDLAKLLIMGK